MYGTDWGIGFGWGRDALPLKSGQAAISEEIAAFAVALPKRPISADVTDMTLSAL